MDPERSEKKNFRRIYIYIHTHIYLRKANPKCNLRLWCQNIMQNSHAIYWTTLLLSLHAILLITQELPLAPVSKGGQMVNRRSRVTITSMCGYRGTDSNCWEATARASNLVCSKQKRNSVFGANEACRLGGEQAASHAGGTTRNSSGPLEGLGTWQGALQSSQWHWSTWVVTPPGAAFLLLQHCFDFFAFLI